MFESRVLNFLACEVDDIISLVGQFSAQTAPSGAV